MENETILEINLELQKKLWFGLSDGLYIRDNEIITKEELEKRRMSE